MHKAFILRAKKVAKYSIFKVLKFLFCRPPASFLKVSKFVCFKRDLTYKYTWPGRGGREKGSHCCITNAVINLLALQRHTECHIIILHQATSDLSPVLLTITWG